MTCSRCKAISSLMSRGPRDGCSQVACGMSPAGREPTNTTASSKSRPISCRSSWMDCIARPSLSSGVKGRSEEHTSELQSRVDLVCRLLLEKKKKKKQNKLHKHNSKQLVSVRTHI